MIFLHAHTHGTSAYKLTFVGIESAQNLTPGKVVRKAWHVTVTCPCGGHAQLCLTMAFES